MSIYFDAILPKKRILSSDGGYYSLLNPSSVTKIYVKDDLIPANGTLSSRLDDSVDFSDRTHNVIDSSYTNYCVLSPEAGVVITDFYFTVDDNRVDGVELLDENNSLELSIPNKNQPISMKITKTFPGKTGHHLYDGSFITYTPNQKHSIEFGFDFLPADTYDKFLTLSDKMVLISPEPEEGSSSTVTTSPFEGKSFICQLKDDSMKFEYTLSVKQAGYKGTLTFLES